jgi:hypothetical protein
MNTKLRMILFLFTGLFCQFLLTAQISDDSVSFKGQLVGWAGLNFSDPGTQQVGIRYLPAFSYKHNFKRELNFDIEASLNAFCNARFLGFKFDTIQGNIKPYRFTARISSEQWEIRAGLQKISFGSANMLRPLMWFDQIDARDPLQFTNGVYGVLGRYYFLNNANIWLWGLYGNSEPRGWEITGTSKNHPEIGGRVQLPVRAGEVAISYNHRIAEGGELGGFSVYNEIPENKFGFDIKLDMIVGCWFEGSWVTKNKDLNLFTNQEIFNFGIDYTFGIGNGLYAIAEQLLAAYDENPFNFQKTSSFSLLSLSYPVGLFDTLSGIVYYDWNNNNSYNFLTWQKQFNTINFYLMGYWNPANYIIPAQDGGENLFAGRGVQIMLVWNH